MYYFKYNIPLVLVFFSKTTMKTNKTKNQKLNAFTLVELIIVITILAILGTIAIISYSKYTLSARDSNRLYSLKIIEKWLWVYNAKVWSYPSPDDNIEISASWIKIWYQWYFWETDTRLTNTSNIPLDPLDNNRYTYSINVDKNKYQLLSFFEWDEYKNITAFSNNILINNTYADYQTRNPKVTWDNLWILLDTNNYPIQMSQTGVDLVTTNSWTNYKLYFSQNDNLTWSWVKIFTNIYNKRLDLITNKNLAYFDENLVWYWDMETTFLSWWVSYLKDWSKYNNYWICSDNWTKVNCWTPPKWPQLINETWQKWKAFYFDWQSDMLAMPSLNNLNFPQTEWTIYFKIKVNCSSNVMNSWNIFDTRANTRNHIFLRCIWEDTPGYNLQFAFEGINLWYYPAIYGWYLDKNRNELILTFNYPKKTVSFYINNVLKKTQSLPDNHTSTWQLMYFWSNGTSGFQWNIDEVRLYNRAFTSSEISNLYNMVK